MPDTLGQLIEIFRKDAQSPFQKLSYGVRVKHERLLERITRQYGHRSLRGVRARDLVKWHDLWAGQGKIAAAHSLISRLRVVLRFGATILEDKECRRLATGLGELRFARPAPRRKTISAEQAKLIRSKAREWGWDSIAIAQAFQFDLRLNQKTVIGEWVPMSEPELSDVTRIKDGREEKWVRGLRWSALDETLVLRLAGSRRSGELQFDLKNAPMVMDELAIYSEVSVEELTRAHLPRSGPIILNEQKAFPWSTAEFRRKWRLIAAQAGIPKHLMNMDSAKTLRAIVGAA
ncbi:hypothetical protein IVA79_05075 [Bradyrhizobium sp. 138]|uniref:hypothetical protein n=1 Tax=Bradyrhizobium sp. 138 TaxID=2782615 RepID=UPI001FFAA559|nr:hypothetical protein [Bradyrhizobium sp. 138]MCK1733342.1 hypothetical protein [Bradyrhizobium sp. 138]